MKDHKKKILNIDETIRKYGGFVRYFGTNEPVKNIVDLAPCKPNSRVLVCCGGGDQALTYLGMIKKHGQVYAFDINPAQLFVLACKAMLIKENDLRAFLPSFDDISKAHIGRVKALPRVVNSINKLVDLSNRKYVCPPDSFKKKFGFETDTGFYRYRKEFVFWANNAKFISQIKRNLDALKFVHSDLLYVADLFPAAYFDVIYITDIRLHNVIPFYLERLKFLIGLLKPGGVIVGNDEKQDEQDGWPTIIEIAKNYTDLFGLKFIGKKGNITALSHTR